MPPAPRRQHGFTYLGLIILVAIIGLVGAAGLKMGALLQRNAAEQELLDIGAAFADALESYARATPAGRPRQPASLADLLKDPRFPGVRRHLRKLYVDPVSGRAEWGLMYLAGGTGVVGVHSLSNARPLKLGNFEPRFAQFAAKRRFSEWIFMAAEGAAAAAPAAPAGPPATPSASAPPAPAPEVPAEPPDPPEAEPANAIIDLQQY
jgi:type II secretory pathway pseudopilin PulG